MGRLALLIIYGLVCLPAVNATGELSDDVSTAHSVLTAHNKVRASVGVPPLRWSAGLATEARRWANTLVEQHAFSHDRNPAHGQNLYEIVGGSATPSMVVNAWSDEAHYYDRASNTCLQSCGHYTQIVWRESNSVGCGAAQDGSRQVWVCDYMSPGNYVGERPY